MDFSLPLGILALPVIVDFSPTSPGFIQCGDEAVSTTCPSGELIKKPSRQAYLRDDNVEECLNTWLDVSAGGRRQGVKPSRYAAPLQGEGSV